MRVPPESVGSLSLLVITISKASALVSPSITTLPAPVPYIIMGLSVVIGFIAALCLPPPGLYLPIMIRDDKIMTQQEISTMLKSNVVKISFNKDSNANVFMVRSYYYSKQLVNLHSMSYVLSQTERSLQHTRI